MPTWKNESTQETIWSCDCGYKTAQLSLGKDIFAEADDIYWVQLNTHGSSSWFQRVWRVWVALRDGWCSIILTERDLVTLREEITRQLNVR